MMAVPALSSSSFVSSRVVRDWLFRPPSSLPPLRTGGPCRYPGFSASCAPAAEHERGRTGGGHYYYSSGNCSGSDVAGGGTLYDVLGLAAGATAQEIKAAYRRLARACHPDTVAADRKGASADEFMRVHAAYTTLSDPGKRTEYDRRVMASVPPRRPRCSRSSSSSSSASCHYNPPPPVSSDSSSFGFARRTWETDQCW